MIISQNKIISYSKNDCIQRREEEHIFGFKRRLQQFLNFGVENVTSDELNMYL